MAYTGKRTIQTEGLPLDVNFRHVLLKGVNEGTANIDREKNPQAYYEAVITLAKTLDTRQKHDRLELTTPEVGALDAGIPDLKNTVDKSLDNDTRVALHLVEGQWYLLKPGQLGELEEIVVPTATIVLSRADFYHVFDAYGTSKPFSANIIAMLERRRLEEAQAIADSKVQSYSNLTSNSRYHWAVALGVSIAAADAIWQLSCYLLAELGSESKDASENISGTGFIGVDGLNLESEIMLFIFPAVLAIVAGVLYAQSLKAQYKGLENNGELPEHINVACNQQGLYVFYKMAAAVTAFQLSDILLAEYAGDVPVEVAMFLIGISAALAVCLVAARQDYNAHGGFAASPRFYLALGAAVTAAVVSWCLAEMLMDSDLGVIVGAGAAVGTLLTFAGVGGAFAGTLAKEQQVQNDEAEQALSHIPKSVGFSA